MTEFKTRTFWRATGLAASFLMTLSGASMAQQQRTCAERDLIVQRLADGYGESRQAMGLGANNGVVEVFASSETGTWTITVTMPSGVTCLVASGQAFEALAEDLIPVEDSDA